MRTIIITFIYLLYASVSLAGWGGAIDVNYTNYEILDPKKPAYTASALTQQYSLFIDKAGKLPYKLGTYSGRGGGNFTLLMESNPLPIITQNQRSVGKPRPFGLIMDGTTQILSPYKLLPFRGSFKKSNNVNTGFLSQKDTDSILMPEIASSIISGAEIGYSAGNFVLGYKDNKSREIKGRGSNLGRLFQEGRTTTHKDQGVWAYLPQITGDYRSQTSKGSFLYFDQSTYIIAAGKKQFWAAYKKISYDDKLDKDLSWTEEQINFGNLSGTYLTREWFDIFGVKISLDGQYNHRKGFGPLESWYGNLFLDYDNKLWRPANIKIFASYEKVSEKSGKSESWSAPVFYTHDDDFISESAKFEYKSQILPNRIGEVITIASQFRSNINKNGLFTISPSFAYSTTDSKTIEDNKIKPINDGLLQAAIELNTTRKLWKQIGLGAGYNYISKTGTTDEQTHNLLLKGNINKRFFTANISQSAVYHVNADPKQPVIDESVDIYLPTYIPPRFIPVYERTITEYLSNLSISWVPNINLGTGRLTVNFNATQEFIKTNFASRQRTEAFFVSRLTAPTWGAEINSRMEWTPQNIDQLRIESNAVIEYLPNQIWQASLKAQHLSTSQKRGLQSDTISMIQTARYSIWNDRREVVRLSETITYSWGKTQSADANDYMSGSGEIHLYPRSDLDIYAKSAYIDRTVGAVSANRTDMMYATGATFSRQRLQFNGEWASGWRSDGREEKKWTMHLKMTF